MSERASQTAQRYVDAMNIASAKIEQLQAEVEALRAQVQAVREFCAATNPIRGELHMAALHGWDTAMEMVLQLLESGEIKGFAFRIANLEGRVDD